MEKDECRLQERSLLSRSHQPSVFSPCCFAEAELVREQQSVRAVIVRPQTFGNLLRNFSFKPA